MVDHALVCPLSHTIHEGCLLGVEYTGNLLISFTAHQIFPDKSNFRSSLFNSLRFKVAYHSFPERKKGLKSNLRKTPIGVFLEIFSSIINTIEIILSQKLNLECSKSVKYKRMHLSGDLETTPFKVVWL